MRGGQPLLVLATVPDPGPGLGPFALVAVVVLLVLVAAALVLLLPTLEARRMRRSGWWVYLVCFCLPALNFLAVIAWFAYFRGNPTRFGTAFEV